MANVANEPRPGDLIIFGVPDDTHPHGGSSHAPANKLRVALQVREAMREARKGKPVAFQAWARPSRSNRG